MRQAISDAATHLFLERGFDAVTMDEVAAAADVGRMTVFNHFPRKEDLFFDRDQEGRERLRAALLERTRGISPIEALRLLAHRLFTEPDTFLRFSPDSQRFVETVEASETLKARARTIRDELAQEVADGIAESVGCDPADATAHLAAALLLATWSVAFIQAHRAFRQTGSAERARAVFLAVVDAGSVGVEAAVAGTPYGSAPRR